MGDISNVYGGVNIHSNTHVVAAVDAKGRYLGSVSFAVTTDGYTQLGNWLRY